MAEFVASGSYEAPPMSENDPRSPLFAEMKAVSRLRDAVAEAGMDFDAGTVSDAGTMPHPGNEALLVRTFKWVGKAAVPKKKAPAAKKTAAAASKE